jgi:hypothetical protein
VHLVSDVYWKPVPAQPAGWASAIRWAPFIETANNLIYRKNQGYSAFRYGGNMETRDIGVIFGFFLFGIGLGFLLTPFLGLIYGMPAGIFIGIGIGVVVQQFTLGIKGVSEGNRAIQSKKKNKKK